MPYDISGKHIWLATPERVPYLYVSASIVGSLQFSAVTEVLENSLKSYESFDAETRAFGLKNTADESFDLVVINKNMKLALIWILPDDVISCSRIDTMLCDLGESVQRKLREIEGILSTKEIQTVLTDSEFGVQISQITE